MQKAEFYELIQQASHADTEDRARVASEAVLETLGETVSGGQAEDVAAQLPDELACVLEHADHDGAGYDYDAFTSRVSEHLHGTALEPDDAERYAEGVIAALTEALTQNERQNLTAQLEDDVASLFEGVDLDRNAG